jgi:hypothetical protein
MTTQSRWFRGPKFLRNGKKTWPDQNNFSKELSDDAEKESGKIQSMAGGTTVVSTSTLLFPTERWSSWLKTIQVMAWAVRCCSLSGVRKITLDVDEQDRGELEIIRLVQQEAVQETLNDLQHGLLPQKGPLRNLSPILDSEGIIRVGGRLHKSALPYEVKHPAILPKNHHVVMLIIRHYHEAGEHVRGIDGMLSDIR